MTRDTEGKRNKKKNKFKEKKKHPYKSGGKFRTGGVKIKNSKKK